MSTLKAVSQCKKKNSQIVGLRWDQGAVFLQQNIYFKQKKNKTLGIRQGEARTNGKKLNMNSKKNPHLTERDIKRRNLHNQ